MQVRKLGWPGSDIVSRSDPPVVTAPLGNAEIEYFGVAAAGNKNVGGLDVTMEDGGCVRGVEGVRDFNGEGK